MLPQNGSGDDITKEMEDPPTTVGPFRIDSPSPMSSVGAATPPREAAAASPEHPVAVPILPAATEKVAAFDSGAPTNDTTNSALRAKLTINVADRTKNMQIMEEIPERVTQELAGMDNYYVSISDPRDSTVRGVRKTSALLQPYLFIRLFYTQLVTFLVYLSCVIMVLVQGFGGGASTNWFTFIVTCCVIAEMAVLMLFQQHKYRLALRDRYWRLAEPIILVVGLILEIASWATWTSQGNSGGVIALGWLRLFLYWLPHGKTRWEQLQYGVRTLCSADRRRYMSEGYDLDYAYVHRNLSAMAWPAYNYERLFRNAVEDVVDFHDRKHPNAYLIVNLCSERTYSPEYFHHQTSWYPMDDHNPAELEMMLAFAREAADFIAEDPNSRVVSVHCKGGKGRTGTLCCAYLMFVGLKRNADDALRHFSLLRTRDGASAFQGVQAPSQERYVRYFEKLLKQPNLVPPSRAMRVTGLRLNNIPELWFTQGVGKLWFAIVTKPCTDRNIVYLSNDDVVFNSQVPDPSTYTKKQLRDLFGTDEDNLYKESNQVDAAVLEGGATTAHGYKLDTSSFWISANGNRSRRYSHEQFYALYGSTFSAKGSAAVRDVGLELRDASAIPLLGAGDVVFKFFFARNDPNPLEPPVQFWLHTSFETERTITLERSQIDGPPKDKKAARYPVNFSIELDVEYVE